MRSLRVLFVSAAVCLSLIAGTAGATGTSSGYPYELQVWIGGNYYDLDDVPHTFTPTATGGTYLMTSEVGTPYGMITSWNSTYDIDPQVTNNFTVVNTTLVAQVFTVSVTSPIAPVLPTSLMRGSIGITLTDEGPLDGNGDTDGIATLTSFGGIDVYRAFLDGVPLVAHARSVTRPARPSIAPRWTPRTSASRCGSPGRAPPSRWGSRCSSSSHPATPPA